MAKVEGYINDELVYSKECEEKDIDENISEAFNSYGSIDNYGEVSVSVTDDDGSVWSPV